jgi:glycosyltransferase involved in cell wall biosynthesis
VASRIHIGLVLQGNATWVGGVEYTKNLLKALYALPAEEQASFKLTPLSLRGIEADLYRDMPARFHDELQVGLGPEPGWRRLGRRWAPRWFDRKRTLAASARDQGMAFLYPYARRAVDPPRPRVAAWISDFQHRHLPQFYAEEHIHKREQRIAESVQGSERVVLSSQAAARDFARFFPDHAPKARVLSFRTVAPAEWYAADAAAVVRAHELPERYFIVCNQFWQHKNHRAVFAALALLARRGIRPTVVCTGNLSDYRRPDVAAWVGDMLDEFGVAARVRLLGLIPRLEQIQLMRHAIAVLQPSLFEGWSTVVEDARALGKPIALSALDVHREQDPPRGVFFEPHDAEALAEIMADWWQTLPAGVNVEREGEARERSHGEQRAFARRFLDLARAA